MRAPPPHDLADLLQRAETLSGIQLGALAARLAEIIPASPLRSKGRGGEILEAALGASGVGRERDFPHLGVELKTVPVDPTTQRPIESTFVAALGEEELQGGSWERSWVREKLSLVLFVPLAGAKGSALSERTILPPVVFRLPGSREEMILRRDFEEHLGTIEVHGLDAVTAHAGEALQVRPKAAHGRVRTTEWGPNATRISTVPRGFYLRPRFVGELLAARRPP